jgi:hypothetical protein
MDLSPRSLNKWKKDIDPKKPKSRILENDTYMRFKRSQMSRQPSPDVTKSLDSLAAPPHYNPTDLRLSFEFQKKFSSDPNVKALQKELVHAR